MKINCNYCGKEIDDTELNCPYCGAPVENSQRSGSGEPETIEELKQWYIDHNLPPENITRFFIGKDVKEKRAFGIYYDSNTGDYVVYKNKGNGSRAVRYSGKDEKYAVNEIYQKLKQEVTNQKARNKQVDSQPTEPKQDKNRVLKIIIILAILFTLGLLWYYFISTPDSGYYSYGGNTYYYYQDDWYAYDDNSDSWYMDNSNKEELNEHWNEYQTDSSNVDSDVSSFYDSGYYSSSSNDDDDDWGSDWDNDSSWDSSDSWDSSSSDWDSDW